MFGKTKVCAALAWRISHLAVRPRAPHSPAEAMSSGDDALSPAFLEKRNVLPLSQEPRVGSAHDSRNISLNRGQTMLTP